MLLARSINPSAPTLFDAPLSSHAKSYKPPKTAPGRHGHSCILRDSRTGRPINGQGGSDDGPSDDYEDAMGQSHRFDF